jgi:hypothetical protein
MQNDHIQGILFTKNDTLDLSHRNMASRVARAMAGKRERMSQKLRIRRASSRPIHRGPYAFSGKSASAQDDIAKLAARMRSPTEEDE